MKHLRAGADVSNLPANTTPPEPGADARMAQTSHPQRTVLGNAWKGNEA